MGYWKTEYAIVNPDGEEINWMDDRTEAIAEAKDMSERAEGAVYGVMAIARYADDRRAIFSTASLHEIEDDPEPEEDHEIEGELEHPDGRVRGVIEQEGHLSGRLGE